MLLKLMSLLLAVAGAQPPDGETPKGCIVEEHNSVSYVVCRFDQDDDVRLFLNNGEGEPYGHFNWVNEALAEHDERLVFAMNAGMYHEDRSPVGFYRENGEDVAPINTNDGPGNFHLKPNGVFWLTESEAGVTESQAFLDQGLDPIYATQSGPMLVIAGALHPGVNPDGTSHRRRNGVGVSADGQKVHFAISDGAVTFHEFATLFRDEIGVPNALFLDGQVSRIYALELDRNELGADLGPIVGVVE